MELFKFQSTHPHGVRLDISTLPGLAKSFNPRTHTGCDFKDNKILQTVDKFQSTHPHGVRQNVVFIAHEREEFQSTHPHGVRPSMGILLLIARKFQSTHPHGVRLIKDKDD